MAVSFAGLKLNENARASINSKSAVSMMYCICMPVLFRQLFLTQEVIPALQSRSKTSLSMD